MIFRVNKTKNYTIMSNYHLQDKELSLKAKGLLSQMLSLPEDWDYSIKGLCAINKENETAITNALTELKEHKYLRVTKITPKDSGTGRIEYVYDVFETPIQGGDFLPLEILDLENQGQLNTKEQNTLSKDKEDKPKKKTRYESCLDEINKRYTDENLINALVIHLNEHCNGLRGVNQWKGLLNQLDNLDGDKVAIVNQSTSSGWFKFYELKSSNYYKNSSTSICNKNVQSMQYTEEQKQKEQEIRERRKANGERICF